MKISPFFLDLSREEKLLISKTTKKILDSGVLILGKNTEKFESLFAKLIGTNYAVSMNSGTSALETALTIKLKCCRVDQNKTCNNCCKKYIAVPSNTNFATVAAIIKARAIPVFMDMDPDYFSPGLNELKLIHKTFPKIAGVVTVHIGGIIHPDILNIKKYCHENNMFLIEDCAHAHGSSVFNKVAGSIGDIGCFSFFPTKLITTIEGGMITTNSKQDYEIVKSMRNQGKRFGSYNSFHTDLGNSWRMNEISAYIGCIQLAKIPQMINRREKVINLIRNMLTKKKEVSVCKTSHMNTCSNYKMIIKIKDKKRKTILKNTFAKKNIFFGGEVYETPCHKQPVFRSIKNNFNNLKNTNYYCPRHLCPPVHSGLSKVQIAYLIKNMQELFK